MKARYLYFALFYGILEAKTATQWSDLNQNPTPNPTNINVFENSRLDLTIDSAFIKNGGAYSGDITINNNHNLVINANVLAVDNAQGSALQTTIYKNHTQGTTTNIIGDGTMALYIAGVKQAKSLFDADNGGKILIDVYTSVSIAQGQGLFSVFRSGANSSITFEKALNVNVSSAVGGLTPSGSIGTLKPIFDISEGSIYVNPNLKNNDIILKGDIFSSGTLVANFITSRSSLEGKVALRDSSNTKFGFDSQARAVNTVFDLANNSVMSILADNQSQISGTLKLIDNTRANLTINNSSFLVDMNALGGSQSISNLTGGTWRGNLVADGQSNHTLELNQTSLYNGAINLGDNARYRLNSSASRIEGSVSASGGSAFESSISSQSTGSFSLSLIENATSGFSLTQNSTYEGRITQKGSSQSQITIDTNSLFSSYITISDTPSFSIQMQGGSTSKGIIELSTGANPTQAQVNLNNATFIGNILQDTTDHIQMAMSDNSTWYMQESSNVNTLSFTNASNVDFTTTNFDTTQKRSLANINEGNRLLLKANTISGNGGIFSLYGILNRTAWGRDNSGGIIATDKISTSTLQGTHNIKIFWDLNNLDDTLLQANLYDDHIVVAEQTSTNGGGEFVGAKSSFGVYEYDTKLTKVEKKDENDNVVGYEWILGEKVEPAPEPPTEPEPEPTPTPDPDPEPPIEPPINPDPEPTPEPEQPKPEPTPDPLPTPPITLPTPTLSTPAKVINTLLSSQYKMWYFQTENLHSRLGDLRNLTTPINIWSKLKYTLLLGEEDSERIASKQMNTSLSFGADYSFYTPYGRNFLGGGFDVSFYQDEGGEFEGVSKAYEGSGVAFGVSVYDTFLFHSGLYIDSVLKYYYANSEFSMGVEELLGNAPKLSTHGFLASIEVGKKFRLPIFTQDFQRGFFYLKPEAGVSVGVVSGQSVEFSHIGGYLLNSTLSTATPWQMRASVDFGKRFDSQKMLGDIFVSFGGEYTTFSQGGVEISSPANSVDLKSKGVFNLKVGVGGNIIFHQNARVYFEANSKFLGYLQPVFGLNVGVRFSFGESIATPPQGGGSNPSRGGEYMILD